MTSHDNVTDIETRLRRKHQAMPAQGSASLGTDGLGNTVSTSYITDDGMRLVNPDGPEAAELIATLRKQLENAREALEPSAATKYCYSGEFKQNITLRDEDGEEYSYPVTIEWTTIKEIMAAINARALKGQQP